MISASHNPFYDNGIKLMNGIGEKMEDALQAELERFIDGEPAALPWATEGKIGKTIDFYSAATAISATSPALRPGPLKSTR